MIENIDAVALLKRNLHRTEMLIEAIVKIEAYNRLYQMEFVRNQECYETVKVIQNQQLEHIERSCGEHAIISLATAFETYYKELLQQLLSEYPDYFLSKRTAYSDTVGNLIEDSELRTYEGIQRALKLRNRFDYYAFFKAYSIPFLSQDEEEFIEYIVLRRNSYVHNPGRLDTTTTERLATIKPPFNEKSISTEAKRIRTKFQRILFKSHDRIKFILSQG